MKFTIKDFNKKYKTDDDCLHEIFLKNFGNQAQCKTCNKAFKYYKVTGRKCYSCSYCGHQIYPLANTIFHKSSTPLKSWFYAIFLFSVSKNGVSGKELERQLGVTYKCAYRIARQVRKLFSNTNKLNGIVEIDETYMGGKESNKHKSKKTKNTQGRSLKTKVPIIGAVEREGNIIAKVVCSTQDNIVRQFVREHIEIHSEVYTDEYKAYNSLNSMGI